MSEAALKSAVTAWPAAERRWYLDMVAQADGEFATADGVLTALKRYEQLPWHKCILLAGDGEARFSDIENELWSTDRHGRWFQSRPKPIRLSW